MCTNMRISRPFRISFQLICIFALLTYISYMIGTKRIFVQILLQRLYKTSGTESNYYSYYGSEHDSEENDDSYFEPLQALKNLQVTVGKDTDQWGLWNILPFGVISPKIVVSAKAPSFGDCWTFKGSLGSLHIDMKGLVQLRRIRMEHIQPDPNYCAPRTFQVIGVTKNGYRVSLVNSEYKLDGLPKQYFDVQATDDIKEVIFYINSNHGNPTYTCIYRIRFYITAKTESKGLLWCC